MEQIDQDIDRWDKSSIKKDDKILPSTFAKRTQSGIFKIRT